MLQYKINFKRLTKVLLSGMDTDHRDREAWRAGSQRIGHYWVTEQQQQWIQIRIPWDYV